MQALRNHIVLIGFKHVGKSAIGKSLSEKLSVQHIDLDHALEELFENRFNRKCTCRDIMQENGEEFFRDLEKEALAQVMISKPSILSLGGGTPLYVDKQKIIKTCTIIHVTAPRGIVYERILMSGLPAFFNPEEDFLHSFNRLWDERIKIYNELQDYLIDNNGTLDDAVNEIIKMIKLKEKQI